VSATSYTLAFIRDRLPKGARSILEVGCGNGDLAASLMAAGYDVLAIDSKNDCIQKARSLGVNATCAEWPCALERTFDALLFTRSLHHIHALDEAVAAAVAALQPGGRIIVEDFRFELDSPRTTEWFGGLAKVLDAAGAFGPSYDLAGLLAKFDHEEERHELHSSMAIAAALERRGSVEQEDAAYYFRYVEPDLPTHLAQALLRYELALIHAGAIDALGRRFVLTPAG
jgi:2-polyprenyl-3-methyl-5-hydroxy-6-metoxy-1,4-benzoquinol methylase